MFNPETGGWTFNGEKERDGAEPKDKEGEVIRDTVLDFLQQTRNVRYEAREIVDVLGASRAAIYRALGSLSNAGLVNRAKVANNGTGKNPTVYWVAWNKSHDGVCLTPKIGETKVRQIGETNSKPDSVRVSEVGETNVKKNPEIVEEKKENFCKTGETNETNTTGQGFEFVSPPENEFVSPQKLTINADPNPPVGHFSQSQLEDMIYYEMDRLAWNIDQVQAVAQRVAGDYIEHLAPGQIMNVVYALRKED
jgi:hypothetical protein